VGPDFYVVVEKILTGDEPLPTDWPVQGTTGYEFIPSVAQAIVDRRGRFELETAYLDDCPEAADLESERRKAKRLIVGKNFAGELARLVQLARDIDQRFSAQELERGITLMAWANETRLF
jgi:(1->4)-alpha-D-glucan 1-alpha-D-glucosylmutase